MFGGHTRAFFGLTGGALALAVLVTSYSSSGTLTAGAGTSQSETAAVQRAARASSDLGINSTSLPRAVPKKLPTPPASSGSAPAPRAVRNLDTAALGHVEWKRGEARIKPGRGPARASSPAPVATPAPSSAATPAPVVTPEQPQASASPAPSAAPATTPVPDASASPAATPAATPSPAKSQQAQAALIPRAFIKQVATPVAAVPLAADPAPSTVTFAAPETPQRMIPASQYDVFVSFTNTTAAPISRGAYSLSYHWFSLDGAEATSALEKIETLFPADVAVGQTVTIVAKVRAPLLADIGNLREQFTLGWDLWKRPLGGWASATDPAVVPLLQSVVVQSPTSDELGLESFYQYAGTASGGGSQALVNQMAGNPVVTANIWSNPSRGVSSFLRLTYNGRDTSSAFAGPGWSVGASQLTRLGAPLQFEDAASALLGWPHKVTLVDSDGTSHDFELNKNNSLDTANWRWDSPAGVHLFLQKISGAGTTDERRWVMTRPDGTKMFFDNKGYQTATADKNGNELKFTYQRTLIGGLNTGVLTQVTDPLARRTMALDYYQAGDNYPYFNGAADTTKRSGILLANPLIVGKLKSVTDVSGRVTQFVYSSTGLLREVTDAAGTAAARTWGFRYDPSLISPCLTSVVDPRGNITKISYFTDVLGEVGRQLSRIGRAKTITDRVGSVTSFDYTDADGLEGAKVTSTVTDANAHTSTSLLDGFGRLEQLRNAKGETTRMVWDADNNVVRLTENNNAISTWAYDPLTGYPTEVRDAKNVEDGKPGTKLTYFTRLEGHVADLATKTTPEGRRWNFTYDAVGNLTTVTDPKGVASPTAGDYTTTYAYDAFGQLTTYDDANSRRTTYSDYDPTGFPRKITDALGFQATVGYSSTGDVLADTSPRGHTSTFTYDARRRPLVTRIPQDTAAGLFLTTPAPAYDANDNFTVVTAANGAVTRAAYDGMDRVTTLTEPLDSGSTATKVSTTAYDPVGNLKSTTSPRGTATAAAGDFTTTYTYDPIDQLTQVIDAIGNKATAVYDGVGNVITMIDARKSATADPDDFTVKFGYDTSHRTVSETDASGAVSRTEYDADGNVTATIDQAGTRFVNLLDERAMVSEVRVPRDSTTTTVGRYEYDQVGNVTSEVSPRGAATATAGDYTTAYVYDELNRLKERLMPFAPGDAQVGTADRIQYAYDANSNVAAVSAPASDGQSFRNVTRYDYFDNGWVKAATDPWGISTNYAYNAVGQQTQRSVITANAGSDRTQAWTYHPDGKLRTHSDDGVPVGKALLVTDNSDTADTTVTGTWATVDAAANQAGVNATQGFNVRTHAASTTTTDTFTWKADIPASGTYEVFARYPAVAGQTSASNASYSVEHNAGTTVKVVNQRLQQGVWVSLGRFAFTTGTRRQVTLSGRGDGVVVADAVKWVRDNSADADTEKKDFTYSYDIDGISTSIKDATPGARVDSYTMLYDAIGRATSVRESKGTTTVNTTTYGYDPNSNVTSWSHDDATAAYEYDARDLLSKATTTPRTGPVLTAKTASFTYDPRGWMTRHTKGNGNTVDYAYLADGLLSSQTERKPAGATVNAHTYAYDLNSNRTNDSARKQNADIKTATLSTDSTVTYDPRDRVRQVTKTGAGAGTETYDYDANDNVVRQAVGGVTTTFSYNRNRLTSATASPGGATTTFGYDVFGRQSVASTAGAAVPVERWTYDGFDRVAKYTRGTASTTYDYDPLDRVRSKTVTPATGAAKTSAMDYLGLSGLTLTERTAGAVAKTYQYTAAGELLSQVVRTDAGRNESSYFSFNGHGDVDSITDENGDNRATYAYSAYGADDAGGSTGVDKGAGTPVGAEPYNAFRFGTARLDASSGTYQMGARSYSPGVGRFLSLDQYQGALADLSLSTSPFSANRYVFASGNPLNRLDFTGHGWVPGWVHTGLDVAGQVPGIGEFADGANAGLYATEGDWTNAAISASGAIPIAGNAATGTRLATKVVDGVKSTTKKADDVPSSSAVRPRTSSPNPNPSPGGGGGHPTTRPRSDSPASTGSSPGGSSSGGGRGGSRSEPEPNPAPARPDRCERPNSFVAGTRVVLADGRSVPIEDVKAGDTVAASDPATGVTEPRKVTEVRHVTQDKALTTLTLDTDGAAGSATATITSTDGHPFWVDQEGAWINAGDLTPGMWLRTPEGEQKQILTTSHHHETTTVYNFTVDGIHTYTITAGNTGTVVHNCGPDRTIEVDSERFGEAAEHMRDVCGSDFCVTYDPAGRDDRREANLKRSGIPSSSDYDRDEAPMAIFKESEGASVRPIGKSANRSLGGYIGRKLRGLAPGSVVRIIIK